MIFSVSQNHITIMNGILPEPSKGMAAEEQQSRHSDGYGSSFHPIFLLGDTVSSFPIVRRRYCHLAVAQI